RNNQLPLTTRMRAAIAALPFEVPKLAVTAVVSEQDFATLLDRRLKRIEEMKAKAIEATPQVEVKPALPHRHYRRFWATLSVWPCGVSRAKPCGTPPFRQQHRLAVS